MLNLIQTVYCIPGHCDLFLLFIYQCIYNSGVLFFEFTEFYSLLLEAFRIRDELKDFHLWKSKSLYLAFLTFDYGDIFTLYFEKKKTILCLVPHTQLIFLHLLWITTHQPWVLLLWHTFLHVFFFFSKPVCACIWIVLLILFLCMNDNINKSLWKNAPLEWDLLKGNPWRTGPNRLQPAIIQDAFTVSAS